LLLFGGAIQLAGEVKARGERRRVRSDWMAVERERGISVSSAVMSFEHEGSPSTCSTRRATGIQREHVLHPDRGRQRGDGARHRLQWHLGGIEQQTRKVFEVCRLRDMPIITFVNKATAIQSERTRRRSPRALTSPAKIGRTPGISLLASSSSGRSRSNPFGAPRLLHRSGSTPRSWTLPS
jgi:hypothetical protein